ncbi:hypothetical protein L6R52_01585 [Myxococcota bacterium]|nr:hypothetical protein [Myxococcota bacterium]
MKSLVAARFRLVALGGLGLFVAACGGSEPLAGLPSTPIEPDAPRAIEARADAELFSARVRGCPGGTLLGDACIAGTPRSTPMEACPSGQVGPEGVCEPLAPRPISASPAAVKLSRASCPAGWAALPAVEGHPELGAHCAPELDLWPCSAGAMSLPGEACVAQGVECPSGAADWATEDELRARAPRHGGRVLYVQAGAASGGDGTRGAPFATIAEALELAVDGDVVALGRGTHEGPVVLERGVALLGACVQGSRVLAPAGGPDPVLSIVGAGLFDVADLMLLSAASDAPGVSVRTSGGDVALRAIAVLSPARFGVAIDGWASRAALDDVVVRNTTPGLDGVAYGVALSGGARATIERSVVAGTHGTGIAISGFRTTLSLTDTVVVAGDVDEHGTSGEGLLVTSSARVHAERFVAIGNAGTGIAVDGRGAELQLSHAWVQSRSAELALEGGAGLTVMHGARVILDGASFVANRERGVLVWGPGSSLTGRGLAVSAPYAPADEPSSGFGLDVGGGADVELDGVVVSDAEAAGILSYGTGTSLSMTDAVIHGMRGSADGHFGIGVVAAAGARVALSRVMLDDVAWMGLAASGDGVEIAGTDVVITGLRTEAGNAIAEAVHAEAGARIALERARFDGAIGRAAYVRAGGVLSLVDVAVTELRAAAESEGAAIVVEDAGRALVARLDVDGAFGAGARVAGPSSELVLFDATIVGVEAIAFADGAYGRAIAVERGGRARIERVRLGGVSEDLAVLGRGSALWALDVRGEGSSLRGATIDGGAEATFVRAAFEGHANEGVRVRDPGSRFVATDLTVRAIDAELSMAPRTAERGLGLSAGEGTSIELERAVLDDAARAAITAERGVDLRASDLTITRSGVAFGGPGVVGPMIRGLSRLRLDANGRALDADLVPPR